MNLRMLRRLRLGPVCLLLMVGSHLSACLGSLEVRAIASPCLNPPEGIGTEDGSNSIVLDVSLYQLRRIPDPGLLDPEVLLEAGGVESLLHSYLTSPDTPQLYGADLHIQRLEERSVSLKRHPRSKALLVVARGRVPEPGSIRVVPLHRLQGEQTLCLEYTSVFLPGEDPGQGALTGATPVLGDSPCLFTFNLSMTP